MSDKMSEWDKQMAAIDKAMQQLPDAPVGDAAEQGKPSRRAAAAPVPSGGRGAGFAVWTRVTLSAVLAVAVTQWPYPHACGLGLGAYLAVLASVSVAGAWSAVASWRHHRALPHVLSLLVTVTGLALVANEILIRTIYGVGDLTWACP